ncbi:RNA pseudouridylate synthase [Phytophthora infestans]|uniref:RNA pseudouridylate synthase n=1 Tax=Phytophthora infestans TaxID=4787 RepID=A0A833X0G3_PHYIN|nr:RNA pseudouridylate synthase [Phytophthora infestans]
MWHKELRWMRHVVRAQDQELRLDRWLRHQFPTLPQSFVQTQLRKRKIRLQSATASNLEATRANSLLREGSVVAIDAHLFLSKLQPLVVQQVEQDIATRQHLTTAQDKRLLQLKRCVVYQDAQFVVLNKPHGLAVQDGSTLTESLALYLPWIAEVLGNSHKIQQEEETQQQLRLVHRLDKETSGVLVLARSRLAAAKFSELLRNGAVYKTYEALVASSLKPSAGYSSLKKFEGRSLKLPVDGKPAHTLVEQVWRQNRHTQPAGTWVQLRPHTGRKHQLRVHCAQELGMPIVGDTKYQGHLADRLYLHATRIRFHDPFTPGKFIDVSCKMQQ